MNSIQRLVRPEKVGHAGTLDPLATGVLVVCVGPATRLVEHVQRMPKRYRGLFLLGRSSDTDDVEGEVRERPELPVPSREQLEAELPKWSGVVWQIPPVYSAVKQDGKRAYARARRGESVELEARPVEVYELAIRRFEYPELELDVTCGSGCYLRSLGRDLARGVGSDAVMAALERTAIGPFVVEQGVEPRDWTRELVRERLIPPLAAVGDLPRQTLDEAQIDRLAHGLSVELPSAENVDEQAIVDDQGRLAALVVRDGRGAWRSEKNFAHVRE